MSSLPTLDQILAEKQRRLRDAERQRLIRDHDRIKQACETLPGFIREAWHVLEPDTRYVHEWNIDAVAEHLEAVSSGEIQRLVINVPPGTMKSLETSVLWPAWEWGPFGRPALRYLSASYQEGYAGRDARKMRDLVLSEWFQSLWPLELTKIGEKSFENVMRGAREAKPFASLTAGRGNRVIIDDPHSTETVESDAELARASRIFRESVTSRLNDQKRDAIIVIMQRLGRNDVCGVIEQYGMDYVKLVLPMEFEVKTRCVTKIGFKDPRQHEGELLSPERFPREVVDRMKKAMGSHAVAGQFQQRPVAREGNMFKRAWFGPEHFLSAVPNDVIRWVRHWDLAATAKKRALEVKSGPARTAGVRIGLRSNGRYVVSHVSKGWWEGDEVKTTIRATAKMDGEIVEISLPQDPGQAGKVQKNDFIKALAGYVVHAEPESGSKDIRALPFATQCEAGNVDLVEGDWNQDYVDELCEFPSGKLKDQVDASSGAFGRLTGTSTYTLDNVR